MKLTKNKLKQIIKEELTQILSEQEEALPDYFMPKHAAEYVAPYMQEESLDTKSGRAHMLPEHWLSVVRLAPPTGAIQKQTKRLNKN